MNQEVKVINNTRNFQFEVRQDGHLAEMVYRIQGNTIYLMHTSVPDALSGKGIASALAKYALNFALDQGYEIVAYCQFVKAYMARHPDWDRRTSS